MNKSLAGLLLPLLSIIFLSSCGHFKKLAITKTATDTTTHITNTVPVPIADSSFMRATAIMNKKVDFSSFSGKAKVHYVGKDQKQELTANIRIQKDSVIWVSVTAMGLFQVARLLVTPDSFKLLNYINKEVTLLSSSDGEKLLNAPVDFTSLQNLLMGNILSNKGMFNTLKDSADRWYIHMIDTSSSLLVSYSKADSTILSQVAAINAAKPQVIRIDQSDYNVDKKSGILFSKLRHLIIESGDDAYDIEINYNGIDFNEPVEFPFNYSNKFTQKNIE